MGRNLLVRAGFGMGRFLDVIISSAISRPQRFKL